MGIPPSEAGSLDWGAYIGLIFQHNLANETEEQSVEAPSLEKYQAAAARAQARFGGKAVH